MMNASCHGSLSRICFALALGGFACPFSGVGAEDTSTSAPPVISYTSMTRAPNYSGTSQLAGPPPAEATPEKPIVQWGQVELHPHLLYRLYYGDGLQSSPGTQEKTWINELAPGIAINVGKHWLLDYTPTLRFYSSSAFKDTLDHAVVLSGGTLYEDWKLGLSQSYINSSQPLIETGAQTDEEVYATSLSASRSLSSKMSLELGLTQNLRFLQGDAIGSQQLSDSKTWSTMDWVNYQFAPSIGAAIGVGLGYDSIEIGSDMLSEQLQGRVTWHPSKKLSVSISGGAEDRQFLDSDQGNLINPIYSAAIEWLPQETTTFSLSAGRTVTPSYFSSQLTEQTMVTLGLHQRLFKKLSLDLGGGYRWTGYKASVQGLPVDREDDGTFFSARLGMGVLRRGTVAIFYQTSDNNSTDGDFSYTSTQIGLEFGLHF